MRSPSAELLMPSLSGKFGTPSAKMRASRLNGISRCQRDRPVRRARVAVNTLPISARPRRPLHGSASPRVGPAPAMRLPSKVTVNTFGSASTPAKRGIIKKVPCPEYARSNDRNREHPLAGNNLNCLDESALQLWICFFAFFGIEL